MHEDLTEHQAPDDTEKPRLYMLPFDRANYDATKPPCQALIRSFYAAGVHYHTLTAGGVMVNVGKKQLQALMESGVFVWVRTSSPQSLPGSPGLSILIDMSTTRNLYAPEFFHPILGRSELRVFGELAHRFSFIGRKRPFRPEGAEL